MPTLKTQKLIKIIHISPSNTNLDQNKVEYIAKNLDIELLKAFPGRFDSEWKFVITDGNHRLEALKRRNIEFAPVVELTHEEWVDIVFNKKSIGFYVERSAIYLPPPLPL